MPQRGELASLDVQKMPTQLEWRRVASRYPRRVTLEAGLATRFFSDCFGVMQPGDMTLIGLPDDKRKKLLALSAEIKACQAQLNTLQATYQRLLSKGPWVMHRRDLFREGIQPLKAYDDALNNHRQRLEYVAIKAVRLKEYRDSIESDLIEKSLALEEV